MSARVFNPIIMTELSRLRTPSIDRTNITSAPAQTQTNTNLTAVARVRRDLFGPVDHEETRKFVEMELAQQQLRDSDRWGYDFQMDMPKMDHHKYIWERIASDKIPTVYTGTRTRIVVHRPIPKTPSPPAAVTITTATSSSSLSTATTISCTNCVTVTDILNDELVQQTLPMETEATSILQDDKNQEKNTKKCTKNYQSRITDYMKSRKRPSSATQQTPGKLLESTSKNVVDTPSPMKIPRRINSINS